ncbi:hypothetical protein B0H14DRAFT_2698881, partial [Mycena olivaceomarginata]
MRAVRRVHSWWSSGACAVRRRWAEYFRLLSVSLRVVALGCSFCWRSKSKYGRTEIKYSNFLLNLEILRDSIELPLANL